MLGKGHERLEQRKNEDGTNGCKKSIRFKLILVGIG